MIVIKVELWPGGFEGRKKEIGRMLIDNDGTSHTPKRGHYRVRLMRKGSSRTVQRTARVEDYPRESYPVWELVRRALENLRVR